MILQSRTLTASPQNSANAPRIGEAFVIIFVRIDGQTVTDRTLIDVHPIHRPDLLAEFIEATLSHAHHRGKQL